MEAKQPESPAGGALEPQIDAWRAHLRGSRAITPGDAAELEDHLREQIEALRAQGLSGDEAFLVAVKRMGAIDALTREFAQEHSERLWKQLVLPGGGEGDGADPRTPWGSRKMWVALGLAVAAAVAVKIPWLFGVDLDDPGLFIPTNIAFFTLPFIAAYFAWERPLSATARAGVFATFAVAFVLVNIFPYAATAEGGDPAHTRLLTILHLPIALWLLVGVAYVGGRWLGSERRMDFLRFTGEAFIYYVLIALGGGVLVGMTFGLFEAIGIDVEPVVENWLICGVVGATVVAAWLVEAKQSVIENMAPVLARIFVPLFTLLLLAFVVTMAATGRSLDADREILIVIDLLLVVVFGLLLYSISARDPLEPADPFDWIQMGLVGAALLVDALALWAIGSRISEFGFSPNRTAALGMNLVLLVNLAGSAVLYGRFLRGEGPLTRLWDWQTRYLYVLAGWAAIVALLFPVLFGFQ